jgi:hypothetical protein
MRTREHFHSLSKRAISRHGPMLVTIGAHQIGQHLGVARIALGARDGVPVTVATGRQRIDRIDHVAGLQQRRDPQAAIGLDPDHDLARLRRVLSQQRMQLPDTGKPLRHAPLRQPLALLIKHADVVVGLSPVIPDKDHRSSPQLVDHPSESEKNLSDLMDQCSRHDIPPAIRSPRQPAGARSRSRGATLGNRQSSPAGDSTTSLTNPPD